MRALSQSFLDDLLNGNGLLHAILERVKKDDTLMLAIRNGYINIYYRGGNILKIQEQGNGVYQSFFDEKYNKEGKAVTNWPKSIKSQDDVKQWIEVFPHLKEIMDKFFSGKSKPEREFQQLVARENNFSTISNESEYFVSDIEFADSGLGARFDMLAIRWLASQRKKGSNCRAVLIEMKYGDGALDGSAGLLKHLQDIDSLISDSQRYSALLCTMEAQFNQLDKLGLLSFKRSTKGIKFELNVSERPEVVFILANHNPRSSRLETILNNPEIDEYEQSARFDLMFYVSSFAGYGLHADCMLPLSQFRKLLYAKLPNNAKGH
jgi:hypothetical protein